MKKYIVHFIIWGLGVISYYILDKTTVGDEFQNISVLLIGCLMFYAVYYISMISEIKKIECELNESGIFGGRGMGILITDHNVRETLQIVDRAYIMNSGQILLEGDSDTIANSELARKFYLGEDFKL